MKNGTLRREGDTRVAAVNARAGDGRVPSGRGDWRPPTRRASGPAEADGGQSAGAGRQAAGSQGRSRLEPGRRPAAQSRSRRKGRSVGRRRPRAGQGTSLRRRTGRSRRASTGRARRSGRANVERQARPRPGSRRAASPRRRNAQAAASARPAPTGRWAESRAALHQARCQPRQQESGQGRRAAARAADGGTSHEWYHEAHHSRASDMIARILRPAFAAVTAILVTLPVMAAQPYFATRTRRWQRSPRRPGQRRRRAGRPAQAGEPRPDRRGSWPRRGSGWTKAQCAGQPGRQARAQRRWYDDGGHGQAGLADAGAARHEDQGWRYDTAAGLEEIDDRRVGSNELTAIGLLRAYVDAQQDYAQADRDGDQVLEYAQKIVSSAGEQDGLYWAAEGDAELSPLGPLVAEADAYTKTTTKGASPITATTSRSSPARAPTRPAARLHHQRQHDRRLRHGGVAGRLRPFRGDDLGGQPPGQGVRDRPRR